MPKPGQELVGHSGNDEVSTPVALGLWLINRYRLNYDAFASHSNTLLRKYSTKTGTYVEVGKSSHIRISKKSGLEYDWLGKRVWLNPPYSRPNMQLSIEKCVEERNRAEIIVGLFKCDTSTRNFHLLEEYADLTFTKRLKFSNATQGVTFATVIAVFKQDPRY